MHLQILELILLFLFILPLYSIQSTYYVIPTPDTPCPGPEETCHTLSEYTLQSFQYFLSNTTFEFLPGDHVLENLVFVHDVTNLILRSDSGSLTSTIICQGFQPSLFFQNVAELHISALVFDSCGGSDGTAMNLQMINFSSITSCVFLRSKNTGQRGTLVIVSSELILSNSTFEDNVIADNGGGVSVISSTVEFIGNSFKDNTARSAGGVSVTNSTVNFTENSFTGNTATEGGAVSLHDCLAEFIGNSFINNSALDSFFGYGGGVSILNSTISFIGNTFINNTASQQGGGIEIRFSNNGSFTRNAFVSNTASQNGGAVSVESSVVNFTGNSFVKNYASSTAFDLPGGIYNIGYGGGVYIFNSMIEFTGNTLVNNTSEQEGGGAWIMDSEWNISQNIFQNNAVLLNDGGGIAIGGAGILDGNTFISNTAGGFGGGIAIRADATFVGKTSFFNNTAEDLIGGGMYILNSNLIIKGDMCFVKNSAPLLGGAVIAINTSISFEGSVSLESNAANYGAAIMAVQSFLFFDKGLHFQGNDGRYGAGIYAIEANITFIGDTCFYNNFATSNGGAVYASNSNLYFAGSSNFTQNSASNGGGLLLTDNSKIHVFSNTTMLFQGNSAKQTGGAIAVEDINPLAYCAPEPNILDVFSGDCFFQIFPNENISNPVFSFQNNTAAKGGGDVYGGIIDVCSLPGIIGNNIICDSCDKASSGGVFNFLAGTKSLAISSDPINICVCDNNKSFCTESPISMEVYPGQKLQIPVIAFGQRNGKTASIVMTESRIRFLDLEYTQNTNATCTDLQYTILTSAQSSEEELKLYSTGPCVESLTIKVEILPCPPGFRQSEQACVCDERLMDFTSVCYIDNQTILRPSGAEFWVGYDNNSQGLILYPQCPFDYCTSDEQFVKVDDGDIQCNYNRGGKLCGKCSGANSNVFGSSRCMQCSDGYLALVIAFALAGLTLVIFLFILRLTVAVGTINGLIFYANLVQVNSSIFYKSVNTNILTVFISWLNLDLGIETCFYNGMDVYTKTWLQFVFPIYVWSLVGMIIFISHFSQKITALLGSNPVAVLATLFLLSYAKVLRTIIAVLSFLNLQYPGGLNTAVWSYDGNIEYMKGKHVPLFIIALLSLIFLFLPFTLLLFLGQWIQFLQSKYEWKVLSWINKPTLRALLDAYHAPYSKTHRYWTGLLLLIRCVLFIIFAAVGNRGDLFTISSAVTGLITFTLATGGIYRNHYFGILEASLFLNLVLLATATYHVDGAGGNQAAVTLILLSIVFLTFIGIVFYHVFLQVRGTKMWKTVASQMKVYGNRLSEAKNSGNVQLLTNTENTDSNPDPKTSIPTTWIDLREPLLDES